MIIRRIPSRPASRQVQPQGPTRPLSSPEGRVAALSGVDGTGQTIPPEDSDTLRLLRRHLPLRGRKRAGSALFARLLITGGLVAVFSVVAAGPAVADDLADYLADASDAVYSGSRVVGTTWDGFESVGIVEVQHLEGMATIGSGSSYAMIGDGRLRIDGSSEAALSFIGETRSDLEARYTVAPAGTTEHLGRPAHVLEVTEAGFIRMRMIVDESTSAPVATEVYSQDGSVFRYTSMINFSVSVDPEMTVTDEHPYEMMLPVDQAGLPDDAAGYQLVDVYAGPQGANQAFYTDGLFSFSVFTTTGRVNWEAAIYDELPYSVDGQSYWRVINPASLWVLWNAPGTAIALVGDLPPDHLEQVLAELPNPANEGWMTRMWHRFFG
jgi:outer membrane lipoprotein-sorting protein